MLKNTLGGCCIIYIYLDYIYTSIIYIPPAVLCYGFSGFISWQMRHHQPFWSSIIKYFSAHLQAVTMSFTLYNEAPLLNDAYVSNTKLWSVTIIVIITPTMIGIIVRDEIHPLWAFHSIILYFGTILFDLLGMLWRNLFNLGSPPSECFAWNNKVHAKCGLPTKLRGLHPLALKTCSRMSKKHKTQ